MANVATTLKSAEINSEDSLRQNCIKDLATCFQNSCAAQFDASKDEASYDMCLSDPLLVVDMCKVKLDACIVVTGGQEIKGNSRTAMESALKGSRLWTGVTSMLAGMRVDACTKEVKSGIEAICGEDFSHCVGLNPGTIAELLPTDTLTACKDKNNGDRNAILQYIGEIAQGYALQINDAMYEVCEKAAKDAMVKVCPRRCQRVELCDVSADGDTKDITTKEFVGIKGLRETGSLYNEKTETVKTCSKSVNDFSDKSIILGHVRPVIKNRININNIVFNGPDASDTSTENSFKYDPTNLENIGSDFIDPNSAEVQNIIAGLNNVFENKVNVMLNTKAVHDCMYGKEVTGFKTSTNGDASKRDTTKIKNTDTKKDEKDEDGNPVAADMDRAYTHLLDEYVTIMASKTLELLKEKYDKAERDLQPQIDALNAEISERLTNIEGVKMEEIHAANLQSCEEKAFDQNFAVNEREHDCDSKVNYSVGGTTREVCPCQGYGHNHGFCAPGDKKFFETGEGRNYTTQVLYWTKADYDSSTGTCTLTKTRYKCNNYLSPYCWSWNTTGEQESQTVEKMPIIMNKETMIKEAGGGKI